MRRRAVGDVGLVLLAAGGSTRMGAAKQLLAYRGKPLVRHAAEVALATGCRPVVVVLGARAGEVRVALEGLPLLLVENPRWEEGMGTSIVAGIAALAPYSVEGAVLALADQPRVTPAALNALIAAHRDSGRPVAASRYADTVGVPAFFALELFRELLHLPPAQGCKRVITANPECTILLDCPDAEADLDTPEEYARAVRESMNDSGS